MVFFIAISPYNKPLFILWVINVQGIPIPNKTRLDKVSNFKDKKSSLVQH